MIKLQELTMEQEALDRLQDNEAPTYFWVMKRILRKLDFGEAITLDEQTILSWSQENPIVAAFEAIKTMKPRQMN